MWWEKIFLAANKIPGKCILTKIVSDYMLSMAMIPLESMCSMVNNQNMRTIILRINEGSQFSHHC